MIKISKLFAAMVLAGVASHSFAADTIKIGIAGPKTGPVTQYGDMQFIGADEVLKNFNTLMNQTPETLKEMGKYIKAES